MSTIATEEKSEVGVLLDVPFRTYAPTLLVLQATVVLPWGREQLWLSMPTAPQGNAAWQCAQLALYLDAVREGTLRPGALGLRDFLLGRPRAATFQWDYRREPLHDKRVECQLNLVVEPHAKGTWPGASLVVIESEPGRAGFYRKRDWGGAREVLKEALAEIGGERDMLLARNRRLESPRLASLAAEASDLADRIDPLWQTLRNEGQRAHIQRARAAARGTATEPKEQTTVVLLPRESPLVLNGTVVRVSPPVEDEGEMATRLLLEPDPAHRQHLSAVPAQLMCRLTGPLAKHVTKSKVAPGDRVSLSGRLEVRYYRAEDGIPRAGTVLAAEGFGFGSFAA